MNFKQNLLEIYKQNSKLFLTVGPLALTLLFVIIFIAASQSSPQSRKNQNNSIPTPTVDIVMQAKKLNITSVSPTNNATSIKIYSSIIVTFTNPQSAAEKSAIQINTSPYTQGQTSWSGDNTTLTFTPSGSFRSETKYTVTVSSAGEQFSWLFNTVSNTNISEEEIMRVEKSSAEETKRQDTEFDKNYPWWDNFPIQKDKYFAYFDPKAKKFIGLLYPKTSDSQSVDIQVSSMKNEILAKIRSFNINVDQYGIVWKVTPEP